MNHGQELAGTEQTARRELPAKAVLPNAGKPSNKISIASSPLPPTHSSSSCKESVGILEHRTPVSHGCVRTGAKDEDEVITKLPLFCNMFWFYFGFDPLWLR